MTDTPRSSKRRRLNPPTSAASATRSTQRSAKSQPPQDEIDDVPQAPSKSRVRSRVASRSATKERGKTSTISAITQELASSGDGEDDELDIAPEPEEDELDADPLGAELSQSKKRSGGTRKSTKTSGVSSKTTPSRAKRKPTVGQHVEETEKAMQIDGDKEQIVVATKETAKTNGTVPTNSKPLRQLPEDQLDLIKTIVLSKLTQRRPTKLQNLDSEYTKVHQLLHATVTAGESNSLLLIGARGSSKTAMVNAALNDLSTSQKEHFHTIRLNGFIQTDDKVALKEIWRQLGREMEIDDAEDGGGKSYADTLTMLLALLSHPDEIAGTGSDGSSVAKSVIFIMDEFDLFATHARQTLLYNLLDIAQSRKAPIAVIGLTTRIDVTEALEKRVKSRFSHRYVHLGLPKTLSEFANIGKAALQISVDELTFEERTTLQRDGGDASTKKKSKSKPSSDILADWNTAIETLFATSTFLKTFVHPIYYTTKSAPALLSSLLVPVSTLSAIPSPTDFVSPIGLLTPPDSNLHILASLSELALSLLISACRLSIIHSTDTTNFPLAYAEYVSLASKARINSAASGALASGAGTRVFGKEVARREWEKLVGYGLLVAVASGAFGLGIPSVGGASRGMEMVRIDVALEEIPLSVEMNAVMEKWCLQI